MRITLFNVAIIAAILTTFWFGGQIIARQSLGFSIDPYWMTTNTTVLPTPQWDLY